MSHRIRPPADYGAKVEGPPVKWRPRTLTIKEKLQIVVNQRGMDGDVPLEPMGEGVEFDHWPAIQRRRWDPVAKDTIPPSGSLLHIRARNKKSHRAKTAKEDVPEISKTRRLEGAKQKRAEKRHKMQSRSSFQKRVK